MAYFICNLNVVSEYWINGKIEWYCGFKFSIIAKYHPSAPFPLVFIACHFSKIYLPSEIKRGFIWPKISIFCFKNVQIFIQKKLLVL